jgi:hypothetical protein
MVFERGSRTARMRAPSHLAPQTGEGACDRRRMVRKIVVNRDAANRTAQFHTPFDVFESG